MLSCNNFEVFLNCGDCSTPFLIFQMQTSNSLPEGDTAWLRNMMELAILFVIAVMMLRGFLLEGYLISTGSMAPGLRGFHKQLKCPSCQYEFAFGINFDESVDAPAEDETRLSEHYATCPNCGQVNINASPAPAAYGDQLLVHKGVFDFRRPRRWETVVFLNPASPGEAYVKRVVGLPGETLQVIDGDLFIEAAIARKDLETQRDMRIAVFDFANRPTNRDEWQLPWQMDEGWEVSSDALTCDATNRTSWLKFQNWRWAGGSHVCEVSLQGAEAELDWKNCVSELNQRPVSWMTRLEFDNDNKVLRLRGVMPYEMQRDLISWADSEELRAAIYRLGALSHISPITDRYGYNSLVSSPEYPVRDLMFDVTLSLTEPPDVISVWMPLDSDVFRLDIQPQTLTASLFSETSGQQVRTGTFQAAAETSLTAGLLKLEVSNFDRRMLVAANGQQLFDSVDVPLSADEAFTNERQFGAGLTSPDGKDAARTARFVNQQSRLGLSVTNGVVQILALQLFRDVHYTPGRRKNGVDAPYTVSLDNYFVQGDNSPVSSDSRSWPNPAVPHRLLVGKPFVVHLPSKPGKLTIGGIQLPIRIPDFRRIRYIH